tara:strand:- start:3824 stop:4387 length:564 start_codon:yes stop_codon:yes gene_type:complete
MNLDESIIVLNIGLNEEMRKNIIKYIEHRANKPMMIRGQGNKGDIDKDIRNVNGFTLNDTSISDKIYFRHIMNIIFTYLPNYNVKFSFNKARRLNQIDLLKYKPGGKYEIHVDNDTGAYRTLSCIINLNDDYKGGDLVFFNPMNKKEYKRVKCKTGTIIFFPSTFLFPHAIEPITKGVRYSIVSWLL